MVLHTHKRALTRPSASSNQLDTEDRFKWALEAFEKESVFELDSLDKTAENLRIVHSREYLASLNSEGFLDPELCLNQEIKEAAFEAAESFANLAAASYENRGQVAFHFSRPGSHHAGPDYGMGVCLVNNLAYAARQAQKNGFDRVAIIDFDAHHGNGTEDIFKDDDTVMTASLHQAPFFPGTGFLSTQTTVNYPIQPGSQLENNGAWIAGIEYLLEKIVRFNPDLLLIEAGVDAAVADWSSDLGIEAETFAYTGKRVASLLTTLDIPGVAEIGGGYAQACFSEGLVPLLEGFARPTENSLRPPAEPEEIVFEPGFIKSVSEAFEILYRDHDCFLYSIYPYTAWVGQFLLADINNNSAPIDLKRLQIFQCWQAYKEAVDDESFSEELSAIEDGAWVNQVVGYDFARFMEIKYLDIFAESLEEFIRTEPRFEVELANTVEWV